jgi:uncharacterized protein YbjT (DUF2867 family)
MPQALPPLILITGATGYVGGRLLKELEKTAYRLRCLARQPQFLLPRVAATTEVVRGDVLDLASLKEAVRGVHTAYYLVHSMGSTAAFEAADRQAAQCFAIAARQAEVQRVIYLGGLGDSHSTLSPHLRSRQEVGEILRASGIPVIEFRTSIVIGSGSASFEIIRALVERLPVMITPRWVSMRTQPIAIEDVVAYLLAALDVPGHGSEVFEIGGADQVCYGDIMREYARQRGLRRCMIPVPVLTPHLSSLWLGLVTPVYARIGRQLIDSIRHATVVQDDTARRVFPVQPMGVRQAIARALCYEDHAYAETRWSDALSTSGRQPAWGGVRFGTRVVDSRVAQVARPPALAFKPIRQIGGARGWYYANWLWHLRGWLDLLVGGVGLRRGRRDPAWLAAGDTVDFWRVEAFEHDHRLRLMAEMRLPGRAWLEFEVQGDATSAHIRQTAIFDPVGVGGRLYWYALYPLHRMIFAGMLRGIVRACENEPVCQPQAPARGAA